MELEDLKESEARTGGQAASTDPVPKQNDQASHPALSASSQPSPDSSVEGEYPNLARRIAIITGVVFALFTVGLDLTIVATAVPKITDDFSGIDLVGWYGSAFFITLACSHPSWGKSYQFFSIKYTFMLATFIFELGSLIAGVAPSSTVLIIGRAITGIGAAGIATGGYAVLSVILSPEQRPVFTGLVTTMYSIASAIGPVLGGLFAERATWRWCFYINLPFGGTSAVIIFIFLKPSRTLRPKQSVPFREKLRNLDPIGTLLALGVLLTFARALQVAGIKMPWDSVQVIGLLTASGVTALLFILSQYLLQDRAMLVSKLLRRRLISVTMIWAFCHEAAFYTLLYALPIYFQAASGVSPAAAGVRNIPLLLSCGIASLLAGWLIKRWRFHVPLMVFASAGGCIGTGLLYTLDAESPSSKWIGYQILAGFAYGLGLPLGVITGQAGCPAEDLPATTAMLLFSFCVGSSFGLTAAQSILDNLLLQSLPSLAPSLNPHDVIQAGATEIHSRFPAGLVSGIVQAYIEGLQGVYILIIGFAGVAAGMGLVNKWQKLTL